MPFGRSLWLPSSHEPQHNVHNLAQLTSSVSTTVDTTGRESSRGRRKPCRLALPPQLADDAIQPLTFALVDVLARDDGSSRKRATVRKFTTIPADQHHVEPLLRALRTSALRRSAVEEAQLVIADVDILLHINKHGVPDIDPQHACRRLLLAAGDHRSSLVLSSSFSCGALQAVFAPCLAHLAASNRSYIGTTETEFASRCGFPRSRTVVIPYNANRFASAAGTTLPQRAAAARSTDVYLAANLRRGSRSGYTELPSLLPNRTVTIRDVKLLQVGACNRHGWCSPSGGPDEAIDAASASAFAMLDSRLCLVPRGDTLTSRRLFDALAAGCVPVIVPEAATANAMAAELPFPRSVPWAQIALFLTSAQCGQAAGDARAVSREFASQIEALLNDAERLRELQRRGVAASRQLELSAPRAGTALLRELAAITADHRSRGSFSRRRLRSV